MTVVRAAPPRGGLAGARRADPGRRGGRAAAAFLNWLKRERIAPQYILYTPNDVARFHALRRRGVIPQRRPFALFVLGRYTPAGASSGRATCCPISRRTTPACPWALCAFGPSEGACVLTAAGLGGHVRVGFENNLWLADGGLAASNAELVEQVAAGARLLGRPLADIAATRAFLAETAC